LYYYVYDDYNDEWLESYPFIRKVKGIALIDEECTLEDIQSDKDHIYSIGHSGNVEGEAEDIYIAEIKDLNHLNEIVKKYNIEITFTQFQYYEYDGQLLYTICITNNDENWC
jgi:hypothetical protein